MACYSYKEVVCSIPPEYESKFNDEFGRESDGNPNYDGDYWTITGMWIDDLQAEIEMLKAELSKYKKG